MIEKVNLSKFLNLANYQGLLTVEASLFVFFLNSLHFKTADFA